MPETEPPPPMMRAWEKPLGDEFDALRHHALRPGAARAGADNQVVICVRHKWSCASSWVSLANFAISCLTKMAIFRDSAPRTVEVGLERSCGVVGVGLLSWKG